VTVTLRGLTWDHPRGYLVLDALAAAADPGGPDQRGPDGGDADAGYSVRWERQPLEDFESRPLRTLADDFDLLVIDHPGLGDAVRDGSLQPLGRFFSPAELAGWRDLTIGASFDSYRLAGQQWALPLDAAAQVSVCRPDMLDERPASWADARRVARGRRTAVCLGGPHAFLMFAALCVASGTPPATSPGEFVPAAAGGGALDVMADLLAHADREVSMANPIRVLDAMAAPGGPAYCPLVYGYVTYHRPASGRRRLAAFDAPAGPGGIGSVLGGTGIAVTRSAAPTTAQAAAVAALLRRLLSEPVQLGLYAELGGQSSYRQAWRGDGDEPGGTTSTSSDGGTSSAGRDGGFYRATRRTVESAWVRPRSAGYPAFQAAASAVLRDGLLGGEDHDVMLRKVNHMYASARAIGQSDG
jgi:multiple sugar transport system substrate-binding protein